MFPMVFQGVSMEKPQGHHHVTPGDAIAVLLEQHPEWHSSEFTFEVGCWRFDEISGILPIPMVYR